MELERFAELVDAYGGRESAWPGDERAAMQALVQRSPAARVALQEARELDALLDSYRPAMPDLSERIVAQLPPPGVLERLLNWLFPGGSASLLRPAMAAALPLLMGVAIGVTLPGGAADEGQASLWERQERDLMAAPEAEVAWYD